MNERSKSLRACALTALTLMLLAGICGCGSPPLLPLPVPPLPQEARQPVIPSECSPTCLSALTIARRSWLTSPTAHVPLALPASAPTKR